MGQAKRRAGQWNTFYDALSAEERTIADVSRATYSRFIAPSRAMGMCYRVTFFLAVYLQNKYGVSATPAVGFAHDETGPLMASHAWLEFNGKKTDLTLGFTEHPDVQLQGQVLILDHVHQPGHKYSYHRELTDAGAEALERLRARTGGRQIVDAKQAEHAAMIERSRDFIDPALIVLILDHAA
ncbi:hypothetical protein [Microvirga tunisiensis]|uniref:Uncharacterized protein n=1 Tax=Microvirga tunisiensis TaxID=2108360 RepID=A0A5N7MNN1_9HYPH|nr:hypothetical protein [Microvirga tunisiensis]MPR11497.1 hypothetical protein [Microvirga tunisiensis]MPR28622.1 hypothetical protein [Microvirga tunisiensis]